jgi:hypothetical protein
VLQFPNQMPQTHGNETKNSILSNSKWQIIFHHDPLFPIHRFKQPLANCSTVHIESQLDRLSRLHTTHLQFPYFPHFTFQADQDAPVRSTRYIEFWIRFWFTSWSATSSKLWMVQPNFIQSLHKISWSAC